MATQLAALPTRSSLSATFADTYGIDQNKVFSLLKETALKSKDPVSDAEVAAFMAVCNRYQLDPFTKEIFGFISKGKMQYVVSVDGWAKIANRQAELNGIEFDEHFDDKGHIRAITCRIHRKDRSLPTVVTEYYSECKGESDVWKRWPIRMLRHKAMIQCSRLAFGLAGLTDDDEAERMPGYSSTPVPLLEGVRTIGATSGDPEIDGLMKRLGWSATRVSQATKQYAGRREDLRAYLNGELDKLRAPQTIPPTSQPDPEVDEQQQPAGPEECQEQPEPEAETQQPTPERQPWEAATAKSATRPARTSAW